MTFSKLYVVALIFPTSLPCFELSMSFARMKNDLFFFLIFIF